MLCPIDQTSHLENGNRRIGVTEDIEVCAVVAAVPPVLVPKWVHELGSHRLGPNPDPSISAPSPNDPMSVGLVFPGVGVRPPSYLTRSRGSY